MRKIPASYPQVTDEDVKTLVKVAERRWYTESTYCKKFIRELCKVTGKKHGILVNSGSSANFIAIKALTDYFPGRYILTCVSGFPTVVAPIYQHNKVPIYVDINEKTLSPDMGQIAYALDRYGKDIAGAVFTHTLGFPFDEALVREMLGEDRFFISDCCDALGAKVRDRPVGSWANIGIHSFFPAHHIFAGQGGALTLNDDEFTKDALRYISWGRDCHCLPGQSDVCGKRFGYSWDNLPDRFDHKYTFTKLGYNMQVTEFQGALGYSQIQRLDEIVGARLKNYLELWKKLRQFYPYINFVEVTAPIYEPSPFGFPIILKRGFKTLINPLIDHLEEHGVATRRMFGGNLIRQPAFQDLQYIRMPDLYGADIMLERTFWVGCHPSMTMDDINYIYSRFRDFFDKRGLF